MTTPCGINNQHKNVENKKYHSVTLADIKKQMVLNYTPTASVSCYQVVHNVIVIIVIDCKAETEESGAKDRTPPVHLSHVLWEADERDDQQWAISWQNAPTRTFSSES